MFDKQQLNTIEEAKNSGLTPEQISIIEKEYLNHVQMHYLSMYMQTINDLPQEQREDAMRIATALSGMTQADGTQRSIFSEKEIKSVTQAMISGQDFRKKPIVGLSIQKAAILKETLKAMEKGESLENPLPEPGKEIQENEIVYSEGAVSEPLFIPTDIEFVDLEEGEIEKPEEIQPEANPEEKIIPEVFREVADAKTSAQLYSALDSDKIQAKEIPKAITYNMELMTEKTAMLAIRRNVQSYSRFPEELKNQKITDYMLEGIKHNNFLREKATEKMREERLTQLFEAVPKKMQEIEEISAKISQIKEEFHYKGPQKTQENPSKETLESSKDEVKNPTDPSKEKTVSAGPQMENKVNANEVPLKKSKEVFTLIDTRPLGVKIWDAIKRFAYNVGAFIHNIFSKEKMPYASDALADVITQQEIEKANQKDTELMDLKKDSILLDKTMSQEEKIKEFAKLSLKHDKTLICPMQSDMTLKIVPNKKEIQIYAGYLTQNKNDGKVNVERRYEFIGNVAAKALTVPKYEEKHPVNYEAMVMKIQALDTSKETKDNLFPEFNKVQEPEGMQKDASKELELKGTEIYFDNTRYILLNHDEKTATELDMDTGEKKEGNVSYEEILNDSSYAQIDKNLTQYENLLPYAQNLLIENKQNEVMMLNLDNNSVLTIRMEEGKMSFDLSYSDYTDPLNQDKTVTLNKEELCVYQDYLDGVFKILSDESEIAEIKAEVQPIPEQLEEPEIIYEEIKEELEIENQIENDVRETADRAIEDIEIDM